MGFTGRRVARVLGITEQYVSMLRARATREGSAGLMRRRGRPGALRPRDLSRARSWRAAGESDAAIGARLGVHATTVGRALAGVPRPGDVDPGTELALVPQAGVCEPNVAESESESAEPTTVEAESAAAEPDEEAEDATGGLESTDGFAGSADSDSDSA